MIYLIDATYPGGKADETATEWVDYMKSNPVPEYVKIIDLYAWAGGDGVRVQVFYDIATGKEAEGTKYIGGGLIDLLKTIDGYKAEARVVYNMAEAFEFLGMSAPAT
jgi:hypothetical protein